MSAAVVGGVTVLLLTPFNSAPEEVHRLTSELDSLLRGHARVALVTDRDPEPAAPADWVLEVTGPREVRYLSRTGAEQRGSLSGTAAEVVAAFECVVSPCVTPFARTAIHVAAGVSVGTGEGVDGAVTAGARLALSRAWAVAIDARVLFGASRFVYGLSPGALPLLAAWRHGSLGLAIGPALTVWSSDVSAVTVSLCATASLWIMGSAQPVPGATPVQLLGSSTWAPVALGGLFGVGWRRQVTEQWTLLAVVDAGLSTLVEERRPVSGPAQRLVFLRPEVFRIEGSLRGGLQF